jgi:ribose transport system substrate-binding protein
VLDDCKSDGQICFVGISRYNQGVEYGKQILDMGIKKAQEVVVLLEDNEQLEKQKLVVAGIRNKLQGHDIELRTERLRTRSTFHTEEDIRNIIVNAERRPDVFICLTSDDTLHTIQQIVEYNQVGQIKIIGYFDSEEAREAISKQIMYSVIGVNGSHMGEQAVQAIINYKNHQKISAVYDIDFYRVNYMDVNGNQGDS